MRTDLIPGKTIRWTFADGPMAHKTFEHVFDQHGSVAFRAIDGAQRGKLSEAKKFETAQVNADVCAISYLSTGFTLTVVLDFKTGKLLAFSSNERELTLQHGAFEDVTDPDQSPKGKSASRSTARS
jgi:hypothetical protein